MKLNFKKTLLAASIAGTLLAGQALAADPPNILIIWGDDIGQFNISAYNNGMMGYKTPNIDRIGKEGALFTDWYGQQSSTAGRAAFITGQSPIRTGLTKVGLPGMPEGMKKEDPTLATLLKAKGYKTGQFGKNHLGDRDDMLPTAHGFDEFFGNLYHLNAEEEPENPDYPKNPEFKKKFGPRGVIHSFAGGKITDTGPLTRKRMETIDDEVMVKTLDFMDRAKQEKKPFFIWWNSTRMHIFTHLKAASQGKTGLGVYADGMVEHDGHVGQLLEKLKALGLDENTIIMYSTDNGAETFTWPDGGTTMFRGEKNTNWEGGYRVPTMIKWPGVIKPGTINNDIAAHEDMLQTATRRLVAEFQPEEIYLFGSHAWGTPDQDSDMDLMVIIPQSDERPIRRDQRAQRCLGWLPVSADVLVRTRHEVNRVRELQGSLTREVLQRGRKVYG